MADEAEVAVEPLERELAPWGRVIYSLATLALPRRLDLSLRRPLRKALGFAGARCIIT